MITVASVPSAHVYVDHLATATTSDDPSTRVVRPPDPTPVAASTAGQWWPPRVLDNDWLRLHTDDFDLVHIHFGFETFAPDELAAVVGTLRASATPLVLTVHDLHNPHIRDNRAHLSQLDVLVPAAHTVITLTPGAAEAIAARWGVRARVLPHPHVVALTQLDRPRPHTDGYVVGVHAKNLRSNLDPLTLMDTLVEAVRQIPEATLRLDIDSDVFDQFSHWHSPTVGAKLCDYATYDEVDIRVHPRFEDEQLWTYLTSVDASVLPYRFGTHSGWLEACHDLGTAVVAPTCGFYGQQHPCATYEFGLDTFVPSTLIDAVARTYDTRSTVARATRAVRAAERDVIAAAHLDIYRGALGDVR